MERYTVYYDTTYSGWKIQDSLGRVYDDANNAPFPTKKKAVKKARRMAKRDKPSQLIIEKVDGQVSEKRSY